MDFAICTLDNSICNANSFSKLSNSEISQKRKHLICKNCKAKAYFKKRSKSGQAACFGARPHNNSCSLGTEESETCLGTLNSNEKELINLGSLINVDFDFNTTKFTHIDTSNEDINSKNNASKHSSANGIKTATSKRKLKSLLNILLNDPNFSKSNQKIDIGYKYPYNASTIFRKFEEIVNSDIDKVRGVYGQIFDVNIFNNSIWINSGGYDDCSIIIENNLQEDFYRIFPKYKDLEELNGVYILCFGKILKSQKNKFYIKLNDISEITFK